MFTFDLHRQRAAELEQAAREHRLTRKARRRDADADTDADTGSGTGSGAPRSATTAGPTEGRWTAAA
ncbi:hypothetical protein [Streptomyces avicenniae]|uniref:hypothetical protein n=1 Tax=Streptomyces avicenniae TaxID=500153 RepID=UPI00069A3426|nr:hypothetical protein [Streptomyces avicenniae]